MINLNSAIVEGNLTRDPEHRTFDNGGQVCNFTVACNDDYKPKDSDEWRERCYFINCVASGYLAERVAKMHKGDKVIVVGKNASRQYEKDGQKRTAYEIRADKVMNRTPKDRPDPHMQDKADGYAPYPVNLSEGDCNEPEDQSDIPF